MEFGYIIVWMVLVVTPLVALRRRRWWSSAIYLLGSIIFLSEVMRKKDGWDDLADVATLIVIVIPIYLIATLIWVVQVYMDRKKKEA